MKLKILLTLFIVLFAAGGVAMAMVAVNVQPTNQDRWDSNVSGVASHTTQGGNITQLIVGEQRLTDRWAGYYGNISAGILLTDNDSAPLTFLYKWAANATNITGGEFCASTNASFPFYSAYNTAASSVDTAWGFAGGLDLSVNTFNDGTCNLTFAQDDVNVSTVMAKGDSGNSAYATCVIDSLPSDGEPYTKGQIAFCTDAIRPATGTNYNFKGELVNFELIVATPEDGTPETYYFFMELDA